MGDAGGTDIAEEAREGVGEERRGALERAGEGAAEGEREGEAEMTAEGGGGGVSVRKEEEREEEEGGPFFLRACGIVDSSLYSYCLDNQIK